LREETRVEPPGWFRCFTIEDWARPGDDEVRYPGGALMGVEEVARRRWGDARREWAHETGMSLVDWLQERRVARRIERGWDP
jgi:hypothetical protein